MSSAIGTTSKRLHFSMRMDMGHTAGWVPNDQEEGPHFRGTRHSRSMRRCRPWPLVTSLYAHALQASAPPSPP